MGLRQLKREMRTRTQAEPLPGLKFDNRQIFIESFGPLDKKVAHVAGVLSKIMTDVLQSKGASQGPLIQTPIIIGGNGDSGVTEEG